MALSTKVEEDFVAPLTAIRGALEILRDFPHLSVVEQQRFVETALRGCQRLEQGVEHLAGTVYQAGQDAIKDSDASEEVSNEYVSRIKMLVDQDIVELDFSEFAFTSSAIVNEFYDTIERIIKPTGRSWYVLVNFRKCSVWPEAWVAFAHRGKRVNATCSLGTFRYDEESDPAAQTDPDTFCSREEALRRIDVLKAAN